MEVSQLNIVVFDGICNMCNKAVNFLLEKDKKEMFHFCSLQSPLGTEILLKLHNQVDSILYSRQGKIYTKSSAVLYIAKDLGGLYAVAALGFILPKGIRDWAYDQIAKRRYQWFGQSDSCRIPTEAERKRFL